MAFELGQRCDRTFPWRSSERRFYVEKLEIAGSDVFVLDCAKMEFDYQVGMEALD